MHRRKIVIKNEVKWTTYLRLSLMIFCAFLLEYFSLFVIEMLIMRMDIFNYSGREQSLHHFIMVVIWSIYLGFILVYSRKKYEFPAKRIQSDISKKDLVTALVCLFGCKIMTFIDWHTLKVVGELQGKATVQFIVQYLYYFMEIGIVLLIVMYGQKAIETLIKRGSNIPFGGFILAITWGAFHFVSRGKGIEIWNGISCIIFSVLFGISYLKLKRNYFYSYLFGAIGYLL